MYLACQIVFWASLGLILYTYVGYMLLLKLLTLCTASPPLLTSASLEQPSISILMAAHNEASLLQAKLDNLALLEYPSHLIQTIVVSDGSSDNTAAILGQNPDIEAVLLSEPRGKAFALNQAAAAATGNIFVFFDVRQTVNSDVLQHLLVPFNDPTIGVVSGELLLEAADGTPSAEALGIYWHIEKVIRKLESRTGSVVGATGAIYAMRRSLYTPMPRNTLLDDVFLPMHAVLSGYRVIFQPAAIARDRVFRQKGKEFARKVRTLTGNYQLLTLAPWLLSFSNPLLFRFVSHKLLRLVVPLPLALIFIANALLPSVLYRAVFCLQLLFYNLAACGYIWPRTRQFRPIAVASTFVMLNLAAVRALINFINGNSTWL